MDPESVLVLARRWLDDARAPGVIRDEPRVEARALLRAIEAVLDRRPNKTRPEALLSWLREMAG